MSTAPLGSWPGIPASKQDDELLKRSMLYKVANDAASRGKELTEANEYMIENPSTYKNFSELPLRGGKKSKSKKNKTKKNKTKKNKTKKNKTKKNKKRR